jgi:hypothetical protein
MATYLLPPYSGAEYQSTISRKVYAGTAGVAVNFDDQDVSGANALGWTTTTIIIPAEGVPFASVSASSGITGGDGTSVTAVTQTSGDASGTQGIHFPSSGTNVFSITRASGKVSNISLGVPTFTSGAATLVSTVGGVQTTYTLNFDANGRLTTTTNI